MNDTALKRKTRKEPSADDSVQAVETVHQPFYPAEVYLGEKMEGLLRIGEQGKEFSLPVWRISPLGVELLIPPEHLEDFAKVETGQQVDLSLRIAKQKCEFAGLVVLSRHTQGPHTLIGIRWCLEGTREKRNSHINVERRKSKRWLCGEDFMPTGMAPNPTRFNDFVHFRVKDLSPGGMQIITSLRNKFLIPGMVLESMVSFPMCSQLNVKLRIQNARISSSGGKEYLSLGVTIENGERKLLDTIGQYVFQFGPKTTIEEMQKEGFTVRNASHGTDFKFVQTEEEYLEVLNLRRLAYSAEGKIPADATLESVADIFDSRARILVARHRGEVVASLRLMFHNPEDNYEQENYVKLPDKFPRKDEVVEITRACTHPDFRRSDLYYCLMKHMVITIIQSGRPWMLTCATDKMVPLYEKLGAWKVGARYQHEALGNSEHEVMLCNIQKVIAGKGVNPFVWNLIFSDMTGYIGMNELVDFDPMMNVRMGLYRLMKPLLPFVIRGVKKQKSKGKS